MSARRLADAARGVVAAALLALSAVVPTASAATFPFAEAYRSLEVSSGGHGVALADFDEDHDLDLAVVTGAGRIILFPGQPDGDFEADSLFVRRIDPDLANDAVDAFGAGDFDADGHADLFLTNLSTTALLYGDGRGGFSPASVFDMRYQADTATLVDLNGDGLADMLSAGVIPEDLGVRLARSPRIFGGRVSYALPAMARALAVGDLDGDDAPDIVTDDGSDSLRVFFNDGAGGFSRRNTLSVGGTGEVYELALGDLNGDERLDLAVGSSDGTWVALGDGRGDFSGGVRVAEEFGTLRLNDVIGDGRVDLLIGASDLLVLPGRGDGTFGAVQVWPLDYWGDFQVGHAYGGAFVVAASGVGASILRLDFQGPPPPLPAVPLDGRPSATRLVDLDGDGRLDLVGYLLRYSPAAGVEGALLATALGRGDGGFGAAWTTEMDMAFPPAFEPGEFSGDGLMDLLIPSSDPERLLIYQNHGDGHLLPTTELQPGFITRSLVGGDFNGDGRRDVILIGDSATQPRLMAGKAGGGFAAPVVLDGMTALRRIVVGDFTGDGRQDLLVNSAAEPTWRLHSGRGDGTFETPRATIVPGDVGMVVEPGDLDDDGALDLAAAGDGRVTLFLNRGAAGFELAASFEMRADGSTLSVTDLDGDGRSDLLVGRHADPLALIANEGDGHFAQPRLFGLTSHVYGVVAGELNGDGRPDLVVSDWWTQTWRVALNQGMDLPTSTVLNGNVTEWTVHLSWIWPSDAPPAGYALYRWSADGSGGVRLGTVPRGVDVSGEFTDRALDAPGRYRYVLRTNPADAAERLVAAVEVQVDPALGALLVRRATPNPARGPVTLELERGVAGVDVVLLFDARGRLVRHLAVRAPGPGRWSAAWDLRDDAGGRVPSGVYFARPSEVGGTAARLVIAR